MSGRLNEMLFGPLEAAFAYDTGATDSGHRDEVRVRQSLGQLAEASPDEYRISVSRWVRDTFLTEYALEHGYGLEDAVGFWEWLREQLGSYSSGGVRS